MTIFFLFCIIAIIKMEEEKKRKDSIRNAQKEALKKKDTLPKPKFNQVEKK